MSYILKENNAFYGKKGSIISNKVYNKLPKNHQKLFENCSSDKYKYDYMIQDYIQELMEDNVVLANQNPF